MPAGHDQPVTGLDHDELVRLRRDLDAAVAALEQARRDLGPLDGAGLSQHVGGLVDAAGTAYDQHLRHLAEAVRTLEQGLGAHATATRQTDTDLTL